MSNQYGETYTSGPTQLMENSMTLELQEKGRQMLEELTTDITPSIPLQSPIKAKLSTDDIKREQKEVQISANGKPKKRIVPVAVDQYIEPSQIISSSTPRSPSTSGLASPKAIKRKRDINIHSPEPHNESRKIDKQPNGTEQSQVKKKKKIQLQEQTGEKR